MWSGLSEVAGVTLYGPPPGQPRTPTVSFKVVDTPSRAVAAELAGRFGVFVSDGDFYASTVVDRLDRLAQQCGPRFSPCQLLREMKETQRSQ